MDHESIDVNDSVFAYLSYCCRKLTVVEASQPVDDAVQRVRCQRHARSTSVSAVCVSQHCWVVQKSLADGSSEQNCSDDQ